MQIYKYTNIDAYLEDQIYNYTILKICKYTNIDANLVDQALPVNLSQDSPLVVIPETKTIEQIQYQIVIVIDDHLLCSPQQCCQLIERNMNAKSTGLYVPRRD